MRRVVEALIALSPSPQRLHRLRSRRPSARIE
jgi:hypothetical protein